MTLVHSPSAHTQPGAAKTVADILAAAADLIEPEGAWTQSEFMRDPTGIVSSEDEPLLPDANCWCALGAIAQVCDLNPWESWAGHPADAAMWALAGVVGRSVAGWNDAPGRTQAEVVAALREAAAKAAEAGQ